MSGLLEEVGTNYLSLYLSTYLSNQSIYVSTYLPTYLAILLEPRQQILAERRNDSKNGDLKMAS